LLLLHLFFDSAHLLADTLSLHLKTLNLVFFLSASAIHLAISCVELSLQLLHLQHKRVSNHDNFTVGIGDTKTTSVFIQLLGTLL
jgi:hypothetical protein